MGNELQTTQESLPQAVESQSTAVLQMIERVARDPNADIEKMERLLAMQERVLNKQAESDFYAALNRCQTKIGRVAADAINKGVKGGSSEYATYAALDRVCRPVYTSENLSLSFDTAKSDLDLHITVLCYVSHPSGFSKTYRADMPCDGKGAQGGDVMTKTHAAGSAMSYGMRYLLKMIFNVAIGQDADDDDGNAAGGSPVEQALETIDEGQMEILVDLYTDAGMNAEQFCKLARVDAVANLQKIRFAGAVSTLKKLIKDAKEAAKKYEEQQS
jgi:hypothetical protein